MSYAADIKKLKNYGRGLGVSVTLSHRKCKTHGADYDALKKPPKIVIYKTTPQRQILMLLHELGHHLDWVHRGKREGYLEELPYHIYRSNEIMPKKQRGGMRKAEYNATLYMDQIHEECSLWIPKWLVYRDMILDRFAANYFYETGKVVSDALLAKKKRALTKKRVSGLWLDLYGVV